MVFNTVLEVIVHVVRQEGGIKGIHIGNKEIKLSLLVYGSIISVEKLKRINKISPETVKQLRAVKCL